jgi:hypothetical protein
MSSCRDSRALGRGARAAGIRLGRGADMVRHDFGFRNAAHPIGTRGACPTTSAMIPLVLWGSRPGCRVGATESDESNLPTGFDGCHPDRASLASEWGVS